jgi:hypothetical protein
MIMGITMTTFLNPATTSMLHQFTTRSSDIPQATSRSPFLALPLEVRLQIYGYVLESNPAKHTHLSPSPIYPPATSSAYFLKAITIPFPTPEGKLEGTTDSKPFPLKSQLVQTTSLSQTLKGTGCGYISTALLRTCKQVYEEARMLPWERNEYVFINWFCSGVYAARSFTRALKPWQRESMRWACVDVLRRDLEDTWVATMVGGRLGTGEWKDLCNLWSGNVETGQGGLWGLRLGIKGRVGAYVVGEAVDGSGGVSVAFEELGIGEAGVDDYQNMQKGILDTDARWITQGLAQMKALRWLEVEIEDNDISQDTKVDFCVNLGRKLSDIAERRIDVLLVEKLAGEVKISNQEDMSWGNPGDDYIWALDS